MQGTVTGNRSALFCIQTGKMANVTEIMEKNMKEVLYTKMSAIFRKSNKS